MNNSYMINVMNGDIEAALEKTARPLERSETASFRKAKKTLGGNRQAVNPQFGRRQASIRLEPVNRSADRCSKERIPS